MIIENRVGIEALWLTWFQNRECYIVYTNSLLPGRESLVLLHLALHPLYFLCTYKVGVVVIVEDVRPD